jgi:7-carboxy-7-deazaguanine synthase
MSADKAEKTFRINEIFYSLQGEGVRAGEPSVFVRLTGCNLRCAMEPGDLSPGNFDCDTEFESGRSITIPEILEWVKREGGPCRWIVLTGGEPGLQLDRELSDAFHHAGYRYAVETNGSIDLRERGADPDWITVSPKVAEHCIRQRTAHEVKYVRAYGQGIPRPGVNAQHYLISPAFKGDQLDRETLAWCVKLCLDNPPWRLSVQQHKTTFGGIR